ncbi:MAG: hypothetical protein EHM41_01060 [Chloroflexi bacterium]|nr:MAG: hypothetical protein EHM41_01060 [Chloroflexota bacterium]
MIQIYAVIRGRISQELENLDRVVKRAELSMKKAQSDPLDADLFYDSVALNLHDFYAGLERLFQYIAVNVDKLVPSGSEWHRELLNQMALEIPGIRPAVLSNDVVEKLHEYLRFRHVVRNVYTFQFDPERLSRLVNNLQNIFSQTAQDLEDFSKFLEKTSRES